MRRRRVALLPLVLVVALLGCASQSQRHHPVSVDSRPTPPPVAPLPPGETPGADTLAATPAPAPPPPTSEHTSSQSPAPAPEKPAVDNTPPPPVPVGSVMSPEDRRASLARIVADTTAAGTAVRKCGSRKLLPDQASVLETTNSLLEQARAALASDELWRAESLARKARQLAGSLECPG
jgi:hypothetical protein